MKKSIPWLLGSALLFAVGSLTAVGQAASPTDQAISAADTKAEHEALASAYEQEAQMLSAKAEEHRKMVKAYGIPAYKAATFLGPHCESLANYYEQAARENLELAKQHHRLAGQSPK